MAMKTKCVLRGELVVARKIRRPGLEYSFI